MKLKTLYFDIETSPCEGWFWRPGYKLNLNYNNVTKDASIICISYKWQGQSKIYNLTWDSKQSDKEMLKKFIDVLNSADQIVGHNSDRFDIKWIRTRCYFYDIPMMPNYTSIDTYKEAKNLFNFPSNRLDSIGRYSSVGKKIKTTEELWFDVWRRNDRRALKKMVKYCNQDVILLEKVHLKMLQYTKVKLRTCTDITVCPRCESDKLHFVKRRIQASGNITIQFHCQSCGQYHSVPEPKFNRLKKLAKK